MKSIALSLFLILSLSIFSQKIDKIKIDNYINHIENNNRGIGSLSIFKGGQEVYNRSFGQRNLKNITYNADTKYQVGSVTKMITATLIFKLIEENKLTLESELSEFFPEIENSTKIRIKNLLDHTSGLGDYTVKNDSIEWLSEEVPQEEILNEIIKQGVTFQPNEKVVYSNSAYYLLTQILEKKHDKNYSSIVEDVIIKPLGLKNLSSVTSKTSNVFDSWKYTDKWNKITDYNFTNIIGVGDIAATTKDINVFINALFQYKILKKETVELMKSTSKVEMFGKGLMTIPFRKHVFYGHAGDTYGTHSIVSYNEKDSLTVSFSLNGERFHRNDFAIGIFTIIYETEYELPNFKD